MSVGSTHVLIDIPFGPGSKMPNKKDALKKFIGRYKDDLIANKLLSSEIQYLEYDWSLNEVK